MDNLGISVFQQLTDQVTRTDEKLEQFSRAVENFVSLNGSGDGVRKLLKKKIKNNKKLQQVCKEKRGKKNA